MILGTNANCAIKEVKVTKTKAIVTLIISSIIPTTNHIPFNIWLKDFNLNNVNYYDEKTNLIVSENSTGGYIKTIEKFSNIKSTTKISDTTYWIDRLNNYINNDFNIDINMYKEINIELDITNENNSDIIDKRFVRKCQFYFVNPITNEVIFNSQTIILVSEELEIPEIKNLIITTDKNYVTTVEFKYSYESDVDFNYNNIHLFTEIIIKDAQSDVLLEEFKIEEEESHTSKVKFTLTNKYTTPLKIIILLKSYADSYFEVDKWVNSEEYTKKLVGGTTLQKYSYFYIPKIHYSNLYIKEKGVPRRILSIYSVNKEGSLKNDVGFYPRIKKLEPPSLARGNEGIIISHHDEIDKIVVIVNGFRYELTEKTNNFFIFYVDKLYDISLKIYAEKTTLGYTVKSEAHELILKEIKAYCCSENDIMLLVCSDTLICGGD